MEIRGQVWAVRKGKEGTWNAGVKGGLALQYAQTGFTRSPKIVQINFVVSDRSDLYIKICCVAREG